MKTNKDRKAHNSDEEKEFFDSVGKCKKQHNRYFPPITLSNAQAPFFNKSNNNDFDIILTNLALGIYKKDLAYCTAAFKTLPDEFFFSRKDYRDFLNLSGKYKDNGLYLYEIKLPIKNELFVKESFLYDWKFKEENTAFIGDLLDQDRVKQVEKFRSKEIIIYKIATRGHLVKDFFLEAFPEFEGISHDTPELKGDKNTGNPFDDICAGDIKDFTWTNWDAICGDYIRKGGNSSTKCLQYQAKDSTVKIKKADLYHKLGIEYPAMSKKGGPWRRLFDKCPKDDDGMDVPSEKLLRLIKNYFMKKKWKEYPQNIDELTQKLR